MPKETREEYERDTLVPMGEDKVRLAIKKSRFGLKGTDHEIWAAAWLERQERERNNASSFEQITIARSAKNAAWIAAIAAIIAAISAIASIWISLAR